MSDYEKKYNAYKESLLKDHIFMDRFANIYAGAISAEKDYIDRNGILSKIVVLSAISGFCIAVYSPHDSKIISILSFIPIVMLCIFGFLIYRISANYIKKSGEKIFYSFRVDRHIQEKVLADQQRELDLLMKDINQRLFTIKYYAEKIQVGSSASTVGDEDLAQLLYWINSMDNYDDRYRLISYLGSFIKDLAEDYRFNEAIYEQIHKQ